MKHDVVIVGGGPAGAIAAITLGKLNKKVALIDKKALENIGDKTCGDALDLEAALKLKKFLNLELPSGMEVSDVIKQIILKGSTEDARIEINKMGYTLNRHVYGQRLLKKAMDLGVEIFPRHIVKKPLVKNNFVKGVKAIDLNNKKEVEFKADVVIDASGSSAVIRRSLPRDGFHLIEKDLSRRHVATTYREIVELKEEHHYLGKAFIIYNKTIPSPGYFWIFSKGKKKLNIGLGFLGKAALQKRPIKRLYFKIREMFIPSETIKTVLSSRGYPIPARYPLMNAVENGLICAGDAAYHIDPLLGEGHGPALRAGYYAGVTAASAIDKKDFTSRSLWEYNIKVLEDFGFRWCGYQIVAIALTNIGHDAVNFLLKRNLVSYELLERIIEAKTLGFFDSLHRFLKLFPRYDLLKEGQKAMLRFRTLKKLHGKYPRDPRNYLPWFATYKKTMCSFLEEYVPC